MLISILCTIYFIFLSTPFNRTTGLTTLFEGIDVKVLTWESGFDHERINAIVAKQLPEPFEMAYLREWFYDAWDLKISVGKRSILIDVKTALTQKQPASNWNFLYPVVQASRKGKDLSLLAYFVCENRDDPESFIQLVIPGFITNHSIKNCSIIKAGSPTRFKTISQIDNYETELSKHYQDVAELIRLLA